MSIPNRCLHHQQWIEWILAHPGHPEYPAVDYAVRYSNWHTGGMIGPEPLDKATLPVLRCLVWSPVSEEIKAAKQMFLDLLSKGMIPYKVGVDGTASAEEMREFDPTAEEVIFMPVQAIAGG